jgi:sterol desaturase/sphingolipid hydroxylase (fatty acid hydroxylase superfamily)
MIPLIVLGSAMVMMGIEVSRPGRAWPQVAHWWLRAIVLNGIQGLMVLVAGVVWDQWMVRNRPWSANALGLMGGSIVGYFAITFVYYWWHRWRHEVPFLWRWFHQVHHSPQRIEIITSFYKHPFELLANSLLSSAILYLGVGLSPAAAAGAVLLSGLAELFYHWNVQTPYWLGYIFQRPESHCVHHQEGLHSYNFADLPIWDMLCGTFRNPHAAQFRCGFGSEHEHRLGEMLLGVDVNMTPAMRRAA